MTSNKVIIVAQNYEAAEKGATAHGLAHSEWMYAQDKWCIAGLDNPQVLYYGDWVKHPHAGEIHAMLETRKR